MLLRRLVPILTLVFAGCASQKQADSPEAARVVIVKSAPEGCLELGVLDGSGPGEDAAENELRAKAARMGATHLVLEQPTGSSSDVAISAAAYSCG